MATSPMMQQYQEAKRACGDALLLFRMGDFYELFHEDAETAARVVGLTLTSRDKHDDPVPMAGFPHHQLESYLEKLIRLGYRVAICDQVEDPKAAKGLVRREVTRIVTAGTLTDDSLLNPQQSNFLAAVCGDPTDRKQRHAGLAWVDVSTGQFQAAVVPREQLGDELARIGPVECLVDEHRGWIPEHLVGEMTVTPRPESAFRPASALERLCRQFQVASLEGFGFGDQDTAAVAAAGAVLDYLQETQKTSLDHLENPVRYQLGTRLEIDESTRRSLELTRTLREGVRDGSLLAAIDRTVTPMGARLLAQWLAGPLTDVGAIEARHDALEQWLEVPGVVRQLREQLRQVYDLQRLLARVATGRASPRDLAFIGKTLARLPDIKTALASRRGERLGQLHADLDPCQPLREILERALADNCPQTARDGGIIRAGYNERLDELRELARGGKQWIARYQADLARNASIPSLKVGYNKVFGYYIEVTNAHRDKVPKEFIRKQTLKNAERYVTAELKAYEERVLSADEAAKELEYEIFVNLREQVQSHARRLQTAAAILAELDVLLALAELARVHRYVRPRMVQQPVLKITDGRHPVLDILQPQGTFVPNDTLCDQSSRVLVITGPNMAGKSTYIRQVALITILAQMGSFVPAREAVIGAADRIFARVGASDELSRGQSTFMVEMTEAARILHRGTPRSLVILDEVGRGTSTYDGLSLAWAILEHLHDRVGCRTLFATHYHELTQLAGHLEGVTNLNVAVKEWNDTIVFLHKIVPGAADKSYGIHVAQLAGVPREVNQRAEEILGQLQAQPNGQPVAPAPRPRPMQLTLFGAADHPILEEFRSLDLDGTPPEDVIAQLRKWQLALQQDTQRWKRARRSAT